MRNAVALVVCLLVLVGAETQARRKTSHKEESLGWQTRPVATSILSDRIAQAAIQARSRGPIPLVGFFDVAYPATTTECDSLNKHALLLITTLTWDQEELPIASVQFKGPDSTVKLKPWQTSLSIVEDTSGIVLPVFGPYREDLIMLVPLDIWFGGGELSIDFAKERKGFRLANREKGVPKNVDFLAGAAPGKPLIDTSFAQRILDREYPNVFTAKK